LRLASSDFVDVYDALAAAAARANHVADEHRAGTRMPVDGEVLVAVVRGGIVTESFTALARDLSYNGIGLLQRRRPPRGAQLIVQLPRRDQPPTCMLCNVAHVRQLADDLYAVGATFAGVTTLDQPPTDPAEVERLRRAMME
jgi:hypothetical protein